MLTQTKREEPTDQENGQPINSQGYLKDAKGRFVAGTIGHGRHKGSRNRLGEAFVSDLEANWLENGADAIQKVYEQDPSTYLRVVAGILPKELNVTVSVLDSMSDEDLMTLLQGLRERRRQVASKTIEGQVTTPDK